MRQKSGSSKTTAGQSKPAASVGRTIPDQSGCGPEVDTWPILDVQGKSTPEYKPVKTRSRQQA